MAPLRLSFSRDVRAARLISAACLAVGVAALVWVLAGDPSADGNGTAGVVAAWCAAGFFGLFGAFGLLSLRRSSHASLTIDSTGITTTTGRGTIVLSWPELSAVDLWVDVRRAPPPHLVEPKGCAPRSASRSGSLR